MGSNAGFFEMTLPGPIDLVTTLECGQAFRWRKAAFPDKPGLTISFKGVASSFGVMIAQEEPGSPRLYVQYDTSCGDQEALEAAIRKYLSEQDDLAMIGRRLGAAGQVMIRAVEFGAGLRILAQDPWECLASYIISANNSIPNISRVVSYLSKTYGEPCGLGEYAFPRPEVLTMCSSQDIRLSKCGYRDRFLLDAAARVASGDVRLEEIHKMPLDESRRELMRIKGVGPKVADCVLLFAYHRLEVFPVDVWVARAVSRFYMGGAPVTFGAARAFGMERFGDVAGYAQEYLFHYARWFLSRGR